MRVRNYVNLSNGPLNKLFLCFGVTCIVLYSAVKFCTTNYNILCDHRL